MVNLYPHQEEFIEGLRTAMRSKKKSVLGCFPTGGGKTMVASFMIRGALEKGMGIIFMVHRKELLEQTSNTFTRLDIPHSYIAAEKSYNPYVNCHIAMVDTLKNRLDKVTKPKILIVDECHHSTSPTYKKVLKWAQDGGAYVIGLTATPIRSDGAGLDDIYDDMVLGKDVSWLIENGFLSKYKAYAPDIPDLSNVKTVMGDYAVGQLAEAMANGAIIGSSITHWKKHALGKKTIGFAPNILTSKMLTEKFLESGISAAHVDAETDKDDRRKIIIDFADGKIDVLWNMGLFGEGLDLSAMTGRDVPIEAVILYRPTKSLGLHLQQCGRALRRKPEPAIILDHAGNLMRHGFPDSKFEWSLEGKKKDKHEVKIRSCPPPCYATYEPQRFCPECGYDNNPPVDDNEPADKKGPDWIPGELKEMTKEDLEEFRMKNKSKKNAMLAKAKTMDDLEAIRAMMKYKQGWKYHVAQSKGIRA